jgi:hypothetical protein
VEKNEQNRPVFYKVSNLMAARRDYISGDDLRIELILIAVGGIPQGLSPFHFRAIFGTAEAIP